MSMNTFFISVLITIVGFIIGLGAVTVIDLHGFLARKSEYWTLTTTRTHKVTKPLIWLGTIMLGLGGYLYYKSTGYNHYSTLHIILYLALVLNGFFLSFKVSPFLLDREKEGNGHKILPRKWQIAITISFLISFTGWWTSLFLFVLDLSIKTH